MMGRTDEMNAQLCMEDIDYRKGKDNRLWVIVCGVLWILSTVVLIGVGEYVPNILV